MTCEFAISLLDKIQDMIPSVNKSFYNLSNNSACSAFRVNTIPCLLMHWPLERLWHQCVRYWLFFPVLIYLPWIICCCPCINPSDVKHRKFWSTSSMRLNSKFIQHFIGEEACICNENAYSFLYTIQKIPSHCLKNILLLKFIFVRCGNEIIKIYLECKIYLAVQ